MSDKWDNEGGRPVNPDAAQPRPDTAYNFLRRMYSKISKGWTQGVMYEDKNGKMWTGNSLSKQVGAVCLIGGGDYASLSRKGSYGWPIVRDLLNAAIGDTSIGLARWNDDKSRTKEEVLAVVRKAMNKARREGL